MSESDPDPDPDESDDFVLNEQTLSSSTIFDSLLLMIFESRLSCELTESEESLESEL